MKSKRVDLKSEKGVTLVEVLLSVALLVIIVGPLLGAVYSSVWNNVAAKEKVEAVAMAEKVMEGIKAQGVIGKTKGFVAINEDTSKNLEAYYNIEVVSSGNVAQATSTITPEDKSYMAKIEAANDADFVLEIDYKSSTDGNVYITLKDYNGNILGTPDTVFNMNNESILLQLIGHTKLCAVYKNSLNLLTKPEYRNESDVKMKVICKNNSNNIKRNFKIFTSIPEGIRFTPYVMDDDQTNRAVTFINNKDSKVNYDVEYLDSTYFNYENPINDLFSITVEIRKKVTGNVVYRMSSYVKK
jgi:Tfp pilus assembly protein PilE